MKRKLVAVLIAGIISAGAIMGCGGDNKEANEAQPKQEEDLVNEEDIEIENSDNGESLCLEGIELLKSSSKEALAKFEESAALGNSDAKFLAGWVLDWEYNVGDAVEQDYEKARAYYEEVMEENPYAKICVAFLYKNAQGVDEDLEKAERLAKEAVTAIDEDGAESLSYAGIAMMLIGNTYDGEIFDHQDKFKALEWYELAADKGNAFAMYYIAALYYFGGDALEQDYTKALEWCELAAEKDYPSAMNMIGVMYNDGKGVEQDYTKALEWYELAADQGNADAMFNMGFSYYKGEKLEQDYTKALEWWELAAEKDHTTAIVWIGNMYFYGEGVEQDYTKALEWWEKAADKGETGAMENIAVLYENGLGVEQDQAKADEWYAKAQTE